MQGRVRAMCRFWRSLKTGSSRGAWPPGSICVQALSKLCNAAKQHAPRIRVWGLGLGCHLPLAAEVEALYLRRLICPRDGLARAGAFLHRPGSWHFSRRLFTTSLLQPCSHSGSGTDMQSRARPASCTSRCGG